MRQPPGRSPSQPTKTLAIVNGALPAAADLDGDTVTYAAATGPAHGTVVVNANGTYTYTPAANYNGPDSFTYTVSDANGGSNTYTVTITVNPVNDTPIAVDDSFTGNEDGSITGDVTPGTVGQDSDPDGHTLTIVDVDGNPANGITPVVAPANGTLVLNADGTFTYTPNANFNGTDSFTYRISDGNGGTAEATVTLTVTAVNDAPTAGPLAVATNEDTAIVNGALPAAADLDGDTVTYAAATGPAHGTVVVNANGTYTYTPAANYNGPDSFTYTVSDANGGSNTYTVTITVNPVNDTPIAVDDTFTGNEDGTITGDVTPGTPAQDRDVDADALTVADADGNPANGITPVVAPANGTLVLNADGTFTYTPNANFNGTDSFTYRISDGNGGTAEATVTLTVTAVNDAPTAGPLAVATNEDTAIVNGALPAAADLDGDTVTYAAATGPAHGTVVVNANGTYTYTPAANYNGPDSFTYTVSDANGGSNTYTVTITVNPVNDTPIAVDDTFTGNEDGTITGDVTPGTPAQDRDVDADALTVADADGNPANGITPVVAPSNGTLVLNANGTFTYTPNANFNGTDSFTYRISDGNGGTAEAVVTLTVTAVNDAPTAGPLTVATNEDTAIVNGALPAAADLDGDTVTYAAATGPAHGTVVVNANGTYTYTPAANYNGPDSFTYTVSDANGGSNTYTVTITVNPVNDTPIAVDDTFTGNEDGTITGDVTPGTPAQDRDVDGRCADGRRRRRQSSKRHHTRRRTRQWHTRSQRQRHIHIHAERKLQRNRQLHLPHLRR